MADKKPDMSGPAFPATWEQWGNGDGGMSLRDWFAGQALIGLVSAGGNDTLHIGKGETLEDALRRTWARSAGCAYIIADAMLAAREAAQ